MSRVEIESFIKSFLLFFISLASITALRYYEMYENKIYLFEERLFSQMKISSFNKEPTNFIVTNFPKSSDKISNVFSFNKNQIFVIFGAYSKNKVFKLYNSTYFIFSKDV